MPDGLKAGTGVGGGGARAVRRKSRRKGMIIFWGGSREWGDGPAGSAAGAGRQPAAVKRAPSAEVMPALPPPRAPTPPSPLPPPSRTAHLRQLRF